MSGFSLSLLRSCQAMRVPRFDPAEEGTGKHIQLLSISLVVVEYRDCTLSLDEMRGVQPDDIVKHMDGEAIRARKEREIPDCGAALR